MAAGLLCLEFRAYFEGVAGAGAGAAGAGADAGTEGTGTAGVAGAAGCLDGFENCCSTELPVDDATVLSTCIVSAMDVSMNMMAHHVVAFERNVAAPRGPNAVWLPAPPKAPARSAASPLCSMITMISSPQIRMCSVTSKK
jgi:hypothetical protein